MKKARKVTPLDEAFEKAKETFTKENLKQLAENIRDIAEKIKTTVVEIEMKEKVKGILQSKKSKELEETLEKVKNEYLKKRERSREVLTELEKLISLLAKEKTSCINTLEDGAKFFDSLEISSKIKLQKLESNSNKELELKNIKIDEEQGSPKLAITKEKKKKITEKIKEYEQGIEENEKMITLIEEKIGEIKKLINLLEATRLKLKQGIESLMAKLKKNNFISKLVKSFKTKFLKKERFSEEEKEEIGEVLDIANELSELVEKKVF